MAQDDEYPHKYIFEGFDKPALSKVALTQEEIAKLGREHLGGAQFLRYEGPQKPETALNRFVEWQRTGEHPIRPIARAVTQGLGQTLESLTPAPWRAGMGPAIARAIVPQTEWDALGALLLPGAGRLGSRVMAATPRLGSLLGMTSASTALGSAEAIRENESPVMGGGLGAARGLAGWLAGVLPGAWRRQMPGGPVKAGQEMSSQIGAVMGREVPELGGARTPQELYQMGGFSAGHGPLIKERIEDMYGGMLDRLAQGSEGQKLLIPSLLKPKDQAIVNMHQQAIANMPSGSQADAMTQQSLQVLRDRFGLTLRDIANQLKARKAAFRSSSQSMTAQEQRASVPQIIGEIDPEIASLNLSPDLMKDYAETSRQYKVGKGFLDLLNPASLYTANLNIMPQALQHAFGGLSREQSHPLAARIGEKAHADLADIMSRGGLAGSSDVPGFLPRIAHFVAGRKGVSAYVGSGGAGQEGVHILSHYAGAPGRLPLESSQLWKDLMAIIAQKRLSGGAESPAVP